MKREVKLIPNLRRLHSVTKTDKGKGKNKRKSPFYACTQLVSRGDLLGASQSSNHKATVWENAPKMVPSRSLRSRTCGVAQTVFNAWSDEPSFSFFSWSRLPHHFSQHQVHSQQMARPFSSHIQQGDCRGSEIRPRDVLLFFSPSPQCVQTS